MTSMTDADRDIGNEFAVRKVRLYPAKCAKQGSLTKWINAVRIQAMAKNCDDMLPPLNLGGKCWKSTVPKANTEEGQKELNAFRKKQRRLAELIHD